MKQNISATSPTQAGHVHIDRITVSGPLDHRPLGELFYKSVPGSDEEVFPVGAQAYTPQRRKNPLPDDIFVKSHTVQADGRAYGIRFDCCPPQVLQGHNLFGHNNPLDYAYAIFDRQTAKHEIPVTSEEREMWRTGKLITLTELHLTGNLGCPANAKPFIFDAIDQNNPSGKHRDYETCITLGYGPKGRSQHRVATLYDKFCLLSVAWPNPGPLQAELLRLAEQSIRVEIKLYSQWLRTYGVNPAGKIVNLAVLRKKDPKAAEAFRSLAHAAAWAWVDVDALFFELLAGYNIRNSIQRLLTEDEVKMLSKAERRAYVLWLKGEDLRNHFGRTAVYGLVRSVKEKTGGIDMAGRRRPELLPEIDLEQILRPANLLPPPPALMGTAYYWTPESKSNTLFPRH